MVLAHLAYKALKYKNVWINKFKNTEVSEAKYGQSLKGRMPFVVSTVVLKVTFISYLQG
jgi:hypothetical protein